MPPKKEQKSKAQKALAALSSSKTKGKKKKWSKTKVKDKKSNAVIFDPPLFERCLKEIPKSKVITISTVSEKLRITGSLARRAITELENRGLIKRVAHHSKSLIYTKLDTK